MGTKDPGTTTADGIKLTVNLPGETNLANIELDVQEEIVIVSTPTYLLKETLSRPVDPKSATAKWNRNWILENFLKINFYFFLFMKINFKFFSEETFST